MILLKFLFLSCHTGEGHNSAAEAVISSLKHRSCEANIVDPVSFIGEHTKKTVSGFYNDLIKVSPSSFGRIYRIGEWYSSSRLPSPIYLANSVYSGKLRDYILSEHYDAVVSTHLFGMEAMTALESHFGKLVPSFGVLTDYTVIPFLNEISLDTCFVPHDSIGRAMSNDKLPPERIVATGIPVDPEFALKISKEDARKELGIETDKRIILVMTGGVGCGHPKKICEHFIESGIKDTELYVMVGKNEKLKKSIDDDYSQTGIIHTVSFTKKVNLYMKSSDLLISKAGGLSTTEAAASNIPLIHLRPIPGCELENARFFEKLGMSVWASNELDAVSKADSLLNDPKRMQNMERRQADIINPHAADDIADYVINYGK